MPPQLSGQIGQGQTLRPIYATCVFPGAPLTYMLALESPLHSYLDSKTNVHRKVLYLGLLSEFSPVCPLSPYSCRDSPFFLELGGCSQGSCESLRPSWARREGKDRQWVLESSSTKCVSSTHEVIVGHSWERGRRVVGLVGGGRGSQSPSRENNYMWRQNFRREPEEYI